MRPSSSAASGVTSAGLTTTALPAASAGASFCASLAIGEFHGVIAAMTPIGSWALLVRESPRGGGKLSPSRPPRAGEDWDRPPAASSEGARLRDRLAVVATLQLRELFRALADQRGYAVEHGRPLVRLEVRPVGPAACRVGRFDRLLNVRDVRRGELCSDGIVGGVA